MERNLLIKLKLHCVYANDEATCLSILIDKEILVTRPPQTSWKKTKKERLILYNNKKRLCQQ